MIAALWGDEGTWKTTVGLSFPWPMFHMELDVGGFDRAAWRLPETCRIKRCEPNEKVADIDWSQYDVVTKSYLIPVQIEKLMGAQKTETTVRFPRRLIGYKEVWQHIVVDFVAVCQDTRVKSIFPDSATQLWSICHSSLLQEKQEIQIANKMSPEDERFRERLQPVEFPNDRMRSLIYTAKSYGKNLVLSHYHKDVYADRIDADGRKVEYRTGETAMDGFKDTTKLVDVVVKLFWDWVTNPVTHERKQEILAKIVIKCGIPGLGTTAIGMQIAPNYQGILDLKELLAK